MSSNYWVTSVAPAAILQAPKRALGTPRAPWTALAAHHDLVFAHVEARELGDACNIERVPRNVVDGPRRLVDEVVVALQVGVEDDFAFAQRELENQALFDEQVERVVDGRARQHRKA